MNANYDLSEMHCAPRNNVGCFIMTVDDVNLTMCLFVIEVAMGMHENLAAIKLCVCFQMPEKVYRPEVFLDSNLTEKLHVPQKF